MAERVGFEPTVPLVREHAISSRAYSATLASLHIDLYGPNAAERVGFEPTMRLLPYWFSRPAPSSARPSLPTMAREYISRFKTIEIFTDF